MKYEVIICNTCNTQFAACVKEHADDEWKEECNKYTANGKARFEDADKCNLDLPINPCCGETPDKTPFKEDVRTAEKILESCTGHAFGLTSEMHIKAMKEYGRQCAEKALKDAVEGIKPKNDKFSSLHKELSKIIISTPIITP